MDNKHQTALITGASAGIGRELAKLFARDHYNLILVARDGSRLAPFAYELQRQFGVSARSFPLDLTAASAPPFVFDQLARESISVDVLVNNAGYGKLGAFAEVPLEESLGQIQLNITALTHLTKLLLGPMLARKSGKILNVASTAGFQPGPLMAVYYATKAYVISFSEAVANELKGTGVTVTCLCPGPTETEFASRAHLERTRLFKLGAMTSESVARIGLEAMLRGKTLEIPGVKNKLLAQSTRFAPRKVVTAIARKIQE